MVKKTNGPKFIFHTHSYEVKISWSSLKVEVAALSKERERGLMFRKSLGLNEGMLLF